jgi:hypothetical protein
MSSRKLGFCLLLAILLIVITIAARAPVRAQDPHKVYFPVALQSPSKVGVGWTYYPDFCEEAMATGIHFAFNWNSQPGTASMQGHAPGDVCPYAAFYPMIYRWNGQGACPDIYQQSPYVLISNEPDGVGNQTEQEFSDAVWATAACYPSKRLVIGNVAWDLGYLQRAYAIRGWPSQVRAIGMHCYETTQQCIDRANAFISQANAWGVKVWVTEYGYPHGTMDDRAQQMTDLTTWFMAQPAIEKVFPFQLWMQDTEPWAWGEPWSTKLLNDDGSLTPIGQAYHNVTAP